MMSLTKFAWPGAIALALAACGDPTTNDGAGKDDQRLGADAPDSLSTAGESSGEARRKAKG